MQQLYRILIRKDDPENIHFEIDELRIAMPGERVEYRAVRRAIELHGVRVIAKVQTGAKELLSPAVQIFGCADALVIRQVLLLVRDGAAYTIFRAKRVSVRGNGINFQGESVMLRHHRGGFQAVLVQQLPEFGGAVPIETRHLHLAETKTADERQRGGQVLLGFS